MKISSGDLSPKKSGRTSTNQGMIHAHNPQKAYRTAYNEKIGQTAVECTANYSRNSQNNEQRPTNKFQNLYISALLL